MTVVTDRLPTLDLLHLASGPHDPNAEQRMCLLEAAAYIAGEPWSDHPECVSPVLGAFGRQLNDVLPDDQRQKLKPYITRLIGTAGDGLDEARGLLALDWLVRVYTPTWLRLVPALVADADALAGLPRIETLEQAAQVGKLVRETASYAREAWAAAGAAARAAARAAAGAAAGAGAGAAAWDAAWDAARAAAGAAAGAGAGAAAWDAARAAAGDHLQPTVTSLQNSAIALFDTLITGGAA
jgi:hypothetical protein